MKDLPALLAEHPIFHAVAPSDLKQVEQAASWHYYQKGEKVFLFGDVWPHLLLVQMG